MNLRFHLCCILCMNLNIEHFFLFLAISVVSLSCKNYSVTVFQGPLGASSPNVSVRQNQHSIFECSLSHMAEGFLLEIWNLSCLLFFFFYKRTDFSLVHPVSSDPPKFLPISSTPQPERRQPPQRRHSIEKETPTNVRQFLPASRQSSRSLVSSPQTLQSNL